MNPITVRGLFAFHNMNETEKRRCWPDGTWKGTRFLGNGGPKGFEGTTQQKIAHLGTASHITT